MYQYRLTKYNPKNRLQDDSYSKITWTSVSDIGKTFDDEELTIEKYLITESAYVDCLIEIMKIIGNNEFKLSEISDFRNEPCKIHDTDVLGIKLNETSTYPINSLPQIIRLVLREQVWCKVLFYGGFIHFGYDYYCYIGLPVELSDFYSEELYLEKMKSPYL